MIRILLLILFLSACSSLPPKIENAPDGDPSLQQVRQSIDQYEGNEVRWGGTIVSVSNSDNVSRLQVLAYDLRGDGRPLIGSQATGRFIAESDGLLDPLVYTKNKEITISGFVSGSAETKIDEKHVRIPTVKLSTAHLWTPQYRYAGYAPLYYGGYGFRRYYSRRFGFRRGFFPGGFGFRRGFYGCY